MTKQPANIRDGGVMTLEEIARRLGISYWACQATYMRAIRKMRKKFKELQANAK